MRSRMGCRALAAALLLCLIVEDVSCGDSAPALAMERGLRLRGGRAAQAKEPEATQPTLRGRRKRPTASTQAAADAVDGGTAKRAHVEQQPLPEVNVFLSKAQRDDAEALQQLIDAGMEPSVGNAVGQTALHVACLWGAHKSVQLLIKAGATVNVQNTFSGATPLHCAAQENAPGYVGDIDARLAVINQLLDAGADMDIRDLGGKRAYYYSDNAEVRDLLGEPVSPQEETDSMEQEEEWLPDKEKTPVTIVTGFLGSGKTTFINNLLTEKHGKRIAVIENEFGAIDIDSKLISSNAKLAAKEDVITMDNGCVCCTIRGDLVSAFASLADRREKYDAVVIETTGMADPAPVAFTFNTQPEVGAKFKIDSILCVVDAKHIKQHLDDQREDGVVNEAVNQVAFADRILLNKCDLVNAEEKELVLDSLRSINSLAGVIETTNAKTDVDKLLGIGSFSLDSVSHMLEQLEDDELEHQARLDNHDHHDHDHHNHSHDHHDHDHHNHSHAHEHAGHNHSHAHDIQTQPGLVWKEVGSERPENGHEIVNDKLADAVEQKGAFLHLFPQHFRADELRDFGCNLTFDSYIKVGGKFFTPVEPKLHAHTHAHGKTKKKRSAHLSGVSAAGISIDGELDRDKFNAFMNKLIDERRDDLYRCKGIVAFAGSDEKFVYHGVHEQVQQTADERWEDGQKRVCKMVFIGRNLDKEILRQGLEATKATPTTA